MSNFFFALSLSQHIRENIFLNAEKITKIIFCFSEIVTMQKLLYSFTRNKNKKFLHNYWEFLSVENFARFAFNMISNFNYLNGV